MLIDSVTANCSLQTEEPRRFLGCLQVAMCQCGFLIWRAVCQQAHAYSPTKRERCLKELQIKLLLYLDNFIHWQACIMII